MSDGENHSSVFHYCGRQRRCDRMSKLLPMPPVHRCAEAQWTPEELRREMVKVPLGQHVAGWAVLIALVGGGMYAGLRFLGFLVRVASRFQ